MEQNVAPPVPTRNPVVWAFRRTHSLWGGSITEKASAAASWVVSLLVQLALLGRAGLMDAATGAVVAIITTILFVGTAYVVALAHGAVFGGMAREQRDTALGRIAALEREREVSATDEELQLAIAQLGRMQAEGRALNRGGIGSGLVNASLLPGADRRPSLKLVHSWAEWVAGHLHEHFSVAEYTSFASPVRPTDTGPLVSEWEWKFLASLRALDEIVAAHHHAQLGSGKRPLTAQRADEILGKEEP